jgi:hypothetical protein
MIRPSTDRHHDGIDRYPPVLGVVSVTMSGHTVKRFRWEGRLRREYEVNGEES